MISNRSLSAAAVVGALVIAACSGGGGGDDADATTTTEDTSSTTEPDTTTSSRPTTTEVEVTTTTEPPPVPREPLIGTELESFDDITDRPALAVKIDNAPLARENHTGFNAADIVFEELVEDQLTRFAAVFHSQDAEDIGPIRSGRSQDVDLLISFNEPLFAWSGGNPGVTQLVANSLLTDLNWQRNVASYRRGPGRAPHNLYSDTETLWSLTPEDHPGPPPQQYVYLRDGDEFEGEPVAAVDLRIGRILIEWEWNADDGVFERSQVGAPHIDVASGQITARNVVVMVVDYQPSQIDARSPEAQVVGEGPAFVFSDGEVVEGRWSREVSLFPLEFRTLDGEIIPLTPGNTWIELAEAIPTDDAANPDVEMTITDPE